MLTGVAGGSCGGGSRSASRLPRLASRVHSGTIAAVAIESRLAARWLAKQMNALLTDRLVSVCLTLYLTACLSVSLSLSVSANDHTHRSKTCCIFSLRRWTLCFSFEYRMGRRIPRYVDEHRCPRPDDSMALFRSSSRRLAVSATLCYPSCNYSENDSYQASYISSSIHHPLP